MDLTSSLNRHWKDRQAVRTHLSRANSLCHRAGRASSQAAGPYRLQRPAVGVPPIPNVWDVMLPIASC